MIRVESHCQKIVSLGISKPTKQRGSLVNQELNSSHSACPGCWNHTLQKREKKKKALNNHNKFISSSRASLLLLLLNDWGRIDRSCDFFFFFYLSSYCDLFPSSSSNIYLSNKQLKIKSQLKKKKHWAGKPFHRCCHGNAWKNVWSTITITAQLINLSHHHWFNVKA